MYTPNYVCSPQSLINLTRCDTCTQKACSVILDMFGLGPTSSLIQNMVFILPTLISRSFTAQRSLLMHVTAPTAQPSSAMVIASSPPDGTCSFGVSLVAMIGIGCCLVSKLRQLTKITKTRSSAGLSTTAALLEVVASIIGTACTVIDGSHEFPYCVTGLSPVYLALNASILRRAQRHGSTAVSITKQAVTCVALCAGCTLLVNVAYAARHSTALLALLYTIMTVVTISSRVSRPSLASIHT
jgi:hypothetical protein